MKTTATSETLGDEPHVAAVHSEDVAEQQRVGAAARRSVSGDERDAECERCRGDHADRRVGSDRTPTNDATDRQRRHHAPDPGAEEQVHADQVRPRRSHRRSHATARGRCSSCSATRRSSRRARTAPRPSWRRTRRCGRTRMRMERSVPTSSRAHLPFGTAARWRSARHRRPRASRRVRGSASASRRCARARRARARPPALRHRSRSCSRQTIVGRCVAIPLRSCVESTTVTPSLFRSASRCSTSCRVFTSRPDVGSSRKMTSAPVNSARARNTRCCWPPDRLRMWRDPSSCRPSRSSTESISAAFTLGDPRCPKPGRPRHPDALGDGDGEVPIDLLDLRNEPDREIGPARHRTRSRPDPAEQRSEQGRLAGA